MKSGGYRLETGHNSFERAVQLVRLDQQLMTIVGDTVLAAKWLTSRNSALGGVPLKQIQTATGLAKVLTYLDARRAIG
jgi:hypothetical protein